MLWRGWGVSGERVAGAVLVRAELGEEVGGRLSVAGGRVHNGSGERPGDEWWPVRHEWAV